MSNFLKLTIGSLSITLTRFTQYERILIETGDTEYSINGTPLDSGPVYDPRHIWTIGSFLSETEWQILQAIFKSSDKKRRDNQNYRILVDDTVLRVIEFGTRTRGVAPSGSITTIPGGAISYPARFYTRMLEPKSQKTQNGKFLYNATFTLKELDKVSP